MAIRPSSSDYPEHPQDSCFCFDQREIARAFGPPLASARNIFPTSSDIVQGQRPREATVRFALECMRGTPFDPDGPRQKRDVEPVGAIQMWHERSWATVLRVPHAEGVAWFKACAPVQAFEPRLTAELSSRRAHPPDWRGAARRTPCPPPMARFCAQARRQATERRNQLLLRTGNKRVSAT
jgi:hypothetical protein